MTCNITLTEDGGIVAYCTNGLMTLPKGQGKLIDNRHKADGLTADDYAPSDTSSRGFHREVSANVRALKEAEQPNRDTDV